MMNHPSGGPPPRRGPCLPARRAPRRTIPWAAASALLLSAAAGVTPASAQPRPAASPPAATRGPAAPVEVQGVVLELDKDELVLDLGSDAGVTENLVAELWRPYRVKHPVTGKLIADRFKIGQIQIGQVRPAMSLAKPSGTLTRPVAAGDVVLFTRAPAAASTALAASAPASKTSAATKPAPAPPEAPYDDPAALTAAPADADARDVASMFEALRGQPVHVRIARYEAFLRAHPDSRFAQVLLEEAASLRQLLPAARRASARRESPAPILVSAADKLQALSGKPLQVAAEIRGAAKGVVLHVRRKGDTLFSPLPMTSAGAGYFAATIPADRITDRDLEYFIEAVGEDGPASLHGTAASPKRVEVQTTPQVKPPPTGTGSVSLLTDFADYNRARGNDYTWQTEGTFAMRYKDLGIRAVRMGFGVYRGVSGTVAELDDEGKRGRAVGLTYGYVETEVGLHRLFSLTGRAVVGLLDDGIGGGAQLFARIGNDRGTNLSLGGELLGGVGLRSIVQLELNTFERFPILLRSEVTNQPAGAAPSGVQLGGDGDRRDPSIASGVSEVAGRGIVQLGFRVTPDLVIAVRGSFQGRTINHAGPGVGGSVGYTW